MLLYLLFVVTELFSSLHTLIKYTDYAQCKDLVLTCVTNLVLFLEFETFDVLL